MGYLHSETHPHVRWDAESTVNAACGQLKRTRVEQTLTQADVAKACGVSQPAIAHWETGLNKPTLENFLLWCNALSVDPARLLNLFYQKDWENNPTEPILTTGERKKLISTAG